MCALQSDCAGRSSCVAGRCVAQGATAAIDNGRRLLFEPVDAAYVKRRGDGGDADVATFGRAADGGALALLRFATNLPPEVNVLEAYLLLERATNLDADPVAIALHAERIVEPWDGGSVSWAAAPRVVDAGAPVTRVTPATGPLVRLEVRDLVQRWRRRDHGDFGIAIVAEGVSATGVSFAWRPLLTAPTRRDPLLEPPVVAALEPPSPFEPGPPPTALSRQVGQPRAELVGPRLELYVR
jgi:hypothetical protein